jgi:hypothetical protein
MTTRSPDAFLPMPETHHPSIPETTAAQVTAHLWPPSEGGHPVPIPRSIELLQLRPDAIWRTEDHDTCEPIKTKRVLFTINRCAAPAPFVGDPMRLDVRYTWLVAQDPHGRWIAGPSNLIWREILAGAPQ